MASGGSMGGDVFDRAAGLAAVAAAVPRALRRTVQKQARQIARDFRQNLKQGATRFYDAAAGGRNTAGWTTTGASANAEVALAGPTLRERSRDLERNNPTAHKILSAFVNNVIGDGIRVSFADLKVQALWDEWIAECDTAHDLDFYGQQWLMVYGAALSGEALARRRPRFARDALTVPLQIQLLESDFLCSVQNRQLPNGGRILQGIEFDAIDRRVAYWLWPYHPGDAFGPLGVPGINPVSVPADDIAHMYEATRAGQARGVPKLATIMRLAHDLNDYDASHLTNKRVQANVCAIVYGDDMEEPGMTPVLSFSGDQADENGDRPPVEGLEPGAIIIARGGKQIQFNNPTQTPGYAEYKVDRKHDMAAGTDTPYELATGDLSRVNYSSIRAGLIEYRRAVKSYRSRVVIPLYINKVVRWFLDAAIVSGKVQPGRYTFKCSAPKFEEVDRLKESLADAQEMVNGTTSQQRLIRERGDDPAEIMAERVADAKAAKKKGLPQPGVAVPVQVAAVNANSDGESDPSIGASPPPPDEVAVANADTVQDTAMNGIQVEALLDVIGKVASKGMPAESAKALIKAAFPAVSQTLIDAMIDGAANFTPPPVPQAPAAGA